tara:strand:- start:712 stop:924 length:213 start_codon:yes stop_codon:yes gene_type:complete
MNKQTKDYWKKKALSRDCRCIKGKDRDNNFNEVIDKIFDYFQKKINTTLNKKQIKISKKRNKKLKKYYLY